MKGLVCLFTFLGVSFAKANISPNFYDQLKAQYFAPVPFQYDHAFCTQAMDTFFRFIDLPTATKNKFKGKLDSTHRRGDLGLVYRHKTKGNEYSDKKCFFHYHPRLWNLHREAVEKDPVVKDFFTQADLVWHEVHRQLTQVLLRLNKKHPGIYDKILNTKEPHIILRFLRYDIRTPGKMLAKPHYDAGAMTFAIAESKPGLRIGSSPDDLKLVQHQDGQALFFLSGNFSQLTDPGALKPGWHDVIQVGEKSKNNQYERWALVAFIDGHNTEGAPESLTHKWRVSTKLL